MIEALIKLLEKWGIQGEYLNPVVVSLLGLSVLLTVLAGLWKFVKLIILIRNRWLLNKDLTPYYTRQDVIRATKNFVPTRFQNVSPSDDEEPGSRYIASAKNELIPLFLKKAFKNDSDGNKHYIILADTGMGKTTFLINLYLEYKNQWKNIFQLTNLHDIVLFPLGNPDVLQDIEKIENKKDTILLLDAFDEDIKALDSHKERMDEILGKVQNFREIVITCRTHFFPSEEEEPYKTGYYTFGEDGEYEFQKLYLSVFDDRDVRRYLWKRYSIFSIHKYFKAKEIVKKCPNLIVRPMLLSRIDDLIHTEKSYKYTYEIYETMIDKWIERESKKRSIREKYEGKHYQTLLYHFSKNLAIDMYKNKAKRSGYYINKDEKISAYSKIQISDFENEHLSISEKEARTQSLLNRNSKGQYKFSHKSFLEYFLAKEMIDNSGFFTTFDFEGMSAAKSFYAEMKQNRLSVLGGFYKTIESSEIEKKLQQLTPEDILHISWLKITRFHLDFKPSDLWDLTTLKKLIIFDKEHFSSLYKIYELYFGFDTMNPEQARELQSALLKEINKHPYLKELQERLELLYNSGFTFDFGRKELLKHLEIKSKPSREKLLDLIDLMRRKEQVLSEELKEVNSFLKAMKTLKEKLPNCEIYY